MTVVQRRKEEAADYRYFPEPDLVPIVVSDAMLDEARAGLGELPAAQCARLQQQYGLSAYDAGVLTHARPSLRRLLRGSGPGQRRRQDREQLDDQPGAPDAQRAQGRHRRFPDHGGGAGRPDQGSPGHRPEHAARP